MGNVISQETLRDGDTEGWRHTGLETYRDGDIGMDSHRDRDTQGWRHTGLETHRDRDT